MTHSQEKVHPPSTTSRASTGKKPPGMKKVATASFIGTVIEFYDYNIYGVAAALVFPTVFFPALGAVAGTVASFATLGVAFVARPFGSVLFGHFGDRLGRKKTLIVTMMLMGVATLLVGLMPTATQIGVAAPILIVVLRILQGLAAGGEWGGAVLFVSEHAPKAKRGFWAMFPSLGGGGAIILANATFFGTAVGMSDETFLAWGWRIPFLASILLVAVGLWVRLSIDETPVFAKQIKNHGVARTPFLDAFKSQPRQVLLATGAAAFTMSLTYIGGTYLTSYGTSILELSRPYVLSIAVVGGFSISVAVVLSAMLSDRFGRRRMIMTAACLAIVWTLLLFPLLETRSMLAFAVGVPVTMFISGIATGPLGAFLSELFHTRYRYTATGLSYSLAGMLGGAIPPLIATPIIAAWGGFAFGLVMAGLAALSLICILTVGETKQLDLDREDGVLVS
ncbi:putative MFS family arabinose efflux permease [Rhodococcus rhodochrous J45]|uniref:Putative MFS family arabinose efflux permease n=1 Tax=Rhodococcus rhodochrous J45 TaxID=935266 RepID=A0A562DKY5_RHORH|nr:putative MFS family arabinose efflux permease [Rhodococcus rhodochrous J45]